MDRKKQGNHAAAVSTPPEAEEPQATRIGEYIIITGKDLFEKFRVNTVACITAEGTNSYLRWWDVATSKEITRLVTLNLGILKKLLCPSMFWALDSSIIVNPHAVLRWFPRKKEAAIVFDGYPEDKAIEVTKSGVKELERNYRCWNPAVVLSKCTLRSPSET